jgi:signal transduction histidine kinase
VNSRVCVLSSARGGRRQVHTDDMKIGPIVWAPPSRWTVRMRTSVAATLVVTMCLALAGVALCLVLFRSLETSARSTADARAHQIADELQTENPVDLDRSMLATDSQVAVVQVVDQSGRTIAQSAGSSNTPLSAQRVDPGESAFLGQVQFKSDKDFWVTGVGANSPVGPVTILVGADRETAETVVTTVAWLLAVCGPIVVALAAFGTYRLAGLALQPVERMRAQVSSMTSDVRAQRIPVPPTDDEIARLAVTLNDMLDRLAAGQAAQRRFVSDASHELRSPLATITAALDLAQVRPDELDRELIDEALLPETRRMARLVDDLLLLAHVDENSHVLKMVDVDLDDIIYAEEDRVRAVTELRVGTSVTAVRIAGDPQALSRLVRNLVDNAIRHAHNEIRLECRPVGNHAQVIIADDGPGIPEADRNRVFDRFVRLDAPRTREAGGAGLGLSIAAEIASAHHGRVEVAEAPGGGAQFLVQLPLTVDEPISDSADSFDVVSGER